MVMRLVRRIKNMGKKYFNFPTLSPPFSPKFEKKTKPPKNMGLRKDIFSPQKSTLSTKHAPHHLLSYLLISAQIITLFSQRVREKLTQVYYVCNGRRWK